MKARLLLVDDDEEIRTQTKWALSDEYDVLQAEDGAQALKVFHSAPPDVTLLDLGLPPSPHTPEQGLAVLSEILALSPNAKVIIVSGQGEKENALKAVGSGAYDFLCKPVDLDELRFLLKRCTYVAKLEQEFHEMERSLASDGFEGMVGTSPQMQDVFTMIRKVAAASAPVLILGESGTGKEMAALAIHRRSPRKNKPFVPINCNAIPENLIESELFGHEKGAFTGAHQQSIGLIESAEGGTLFLDEIGELPPPVQVKLLRFLQEQTFMRVGGRQSLSSDTRIVAATNADLKQGITAGTFREDLFFRLAVIVIKLPPLRDRQDDVLLVAHEFLRKFSIKNDKKGLAFSTDAQRAMRTHIWPGNVRELQNRVHRAVILADRKKISAEDLELEGSSDHEGRQTLKEIRETVEKDVIEKALVRHKGRISPAAEELGVSRPTLYELMDKLQVSRPQKSDGDK